MMQAKTTRKRSFTSRRDVPLVSISCWHGAERKPNGRYRHVYVVMLDSPSCGRVELATVYTIKEYDRAVSRIKRWMQTAARERNGGRARDTLYHPAMIRLLQEAATDSNKAQKVRSETSYAYSLPQRGD